MSDAEAPDDLATFVRENRELITRLLAHGDAEARGYALEGLVETADFLGHTRAVTEELQMTGAPYSSRSRNSRSLKSMSTSQPASLLPRSPA